MVINFKNQDLKGAMLTRLYCMKKTILTVFSYEVEVIMIHIWHKLKHVNGN